MSSNNSNSVNRKWPRLTRAPRNSPWSYKYWNVGTYIGFHVFRTYIVLRCSKQNFSGSVVVSRKVILTRLKNLRYDIDSVKAGIREVLVRYRDAVVDKRRRWVEVDCGRFLELEMLVVPHLFKHSDVRKYLKEIDEVLKKVFFR